ncbi:MAG: nucleoside-diphosphate kinase [Treponema sp.]|jgi:nucleoside diphosphate kinase|nr:nucleoside-diphosphate kinase [Treponema sp.]
MSKDLSYVLVTPYTIAKSRTGGVLSRLLSRTDLELVGAQMFAPDETFAREYARSLRKRSPQNQIMLLADYVEQKIIPSGGRAHRTLLLLFRGENPCDKLLTICGHIYTQHVEIDALSGETIRDTYADMVCSPDNPDEVRYFEPAVLTPRQQDEANQDLLLMANFLEGKGNIVQNITHPDPSVIEQTLVIIKPDNWTHNSSRPGTIIDMFSRTGLRIIGIKIHRFSLAQAMNFYGPVEEVLKEKLAPGYGLKAKELLEKEFRFTLSANSSRTLTETFGIDCARDQFAQIVQFMSGKRPPSVDSAPFTSGDYSPEELTQPGDVKSMILIYEGENAIKKIRDVLGPTDPLKAPEGTVRREFGSSVMVNTAHASDSTESYNREKDIIKTNENSLGTIIREYLKSV